MMTSTVDKYYRRIIQNIDNVKMKFDISALLVKSKEHDSKIDANRNNISSNTSLIDTNKNNISSNTSLIDTNKTNISSNLSKINAIKKISDEVFNDKYDIVNQSFNFNKNTHSYRLFEKVIENDMINGGLEINTNINYKYNNLQNDLRRLTHLYEFYDKDDNIFYTITLNHNDFGKIFNEDNNVLIIKDNFCFNIDNKDKIKIILSLVRVNDYGIGLIDLKMINDNSINIVYNKKTDISVKFNENDKKIDTNTNNISSNYNFTQINKKKSDNNTTFIDTNRDNIANNLSKINTIEQNYKLKDITIIDIIKSQIPETVDSNNNFVIINSS